ncbi:unnamed protein product, partial [Coregonus sp. 'balchen']
MQTPIGEADKATNSKETTFKVKTRGSPKCSFRRVSIPVLCVGCFKIKYTLSDNKKSQHGIQAVCLRQMPNNLHSVEKHQASHLTSKPLACSYCGKASKVNVSARDTNAPTQKNRLITDECGKGEKPFVCNHSGKTFALASHLKTHVCGKCSKKIRISYISEAIWFRVVERRLRH